MSVFDSSFKLFLIAFLLPVFVVYIYWIMRNKLKLWPTIIFTLICSSIALSQVDIEQSTMLLFVIVSIGSTLGTLLTILLFNRYLGFKIAVFFASVSCISSIIILIVLFKIVGSDPSSEIVSLAVLSLVVPSTIGSITAIPFIKWNNAQS